MKTVGVFDAKRELPLLLDEVEDGAAIAITRQGKQVARLERVSEPGDGNRTEAAGGSRRSPEEIEAILADFRRFREDHRGALRGLSIRELIDEGRKY